MNLTAKIFHDDEAARLHLEAQRWPDGPYCPHCGEVDAISRLAGASMRPGMCICRSCRKKFSVTVGTIFERSHIGLAKWMLAFRMMAASKKGVSALQIERTLGVTYKTAWFMAHRIREAMRDTSPGPMGGEGKVVEADETAIGGKERNKRLSKRNPKNIGSVGKQVAFTLVERNGRARSFHVANVSGATYSNTAESFFAILKRGVYGNFHSVSEAHLHRYLAEFDFRYNSRSALGVTDSERTDKALKGSSGKRLTYRRTSQGANA